MLNKIKNAMISSLTTLVVLLGLTFSITGNGYIVQVVSDAFYYLAAIIGVSFIVGFFANYKSWKYAASLGSIIALVAGGIFLFYSNQ